MKRLLSLLMLMVLTTAVIGIAGCDNPFDTRSPTEKLIDDTGDAINDFLKDDSVRDTVENIYDTTEKIVDKTSDFLSDAEDTGKKIVDKGKELINNLFNR